VLSVAKKITGGIDEHEEEFNFIIGIIYYHGFYV
jgi:hypothetical protein